MCLINTALPSENLKRADAIEIKIGQGTKQEWRHLPAEKGYRKNIAKN